MTGGKKADNNTDHEAEALQQLAEIINARGDLGEIEEIVERRDTETKEKKKIIDI